jgi:phosphoribosyl 1,2-cyclic phosphodiesterase
MGTSGRFSVTFHGVRGSTPCHGPEIARYGGNTSCVSLSMPGEQPMIFDLGTGLRYFGLTQPTDGTFRGTCLLSHLHWDHTQGLPFFSPILRTGAELDVYAPIQEDGRPVWRAVKAFMQPPHFPISLEHIPGTLRFHDISDDDFLVGGAMVKARLVPHVGNTLGYRVTHSGRSVAYLSDHQQPYDGSYGVADGARELVEGVDLLIHDAQYTEAEFAQKYNWGHCTIEYAVRLAAQCGVKALALFHHDPVRRDDVVDELTACAADLGRSLGVEVFAAREGLTLEL